METLYRKVKVSDRLPDVSKWNIDYFLLEFDPPRKGMFEQGFVHDGLFIRTYTSGHSTVNAPFDPQPTHWLEPIPDPIVQLKADKAELLSMLETARTALKKWDDELSYDIYDLIQKHKQ